MPVGLAGPLRVNGLFAHGDYYVPLATTEAALVASYARGARLITEAGGCTALVAQRRRQPRARVRLRDPGRAALFVVWATTQFDAFKSRGRARPPATAS